ncbi:hypothetical protein C2E23DRAFT_844084 [Lenzites betulinus]|nr:hypothetical protein C2E23DRAFT_844084 [Lenzites betulinus]
MASLVPSSADELAEAYTTLELTYGAYLIGTFLSLMLYGISLHQFYRYIRLYPTDAPFIRTVLFIVMSLETMQIAMLMHTCYWALVTHYLDFVAIGNGVWTLQVAPTISAVITLAAQTFFARRVALVGFRYKVTAIIAGFCLIVFLGIAIALTIVSVHLDNLQNFGPTTEWLFGTGLWFATAADILLSCAIIIALRRSRETYGPRGAEGNVDRFILFFVNTGFMTGIFNLIPTILAVVKPKWLVWAAASYVATRLYANTLLAVLNSRQLMASRGIEIFGPATSERNIIARAAHLATVEQWNVPKLPDPGPTRITINVATEMEGNDGHDTVDCDKRAYAESV